MLASPGHGDETQWLPLVVFAVQRGGLRPPGILPERPAAAQRRAVVQRPERRGPTPRGCGTATHVPAIVRLVVAFKAPAMSLYFGAKARQTTDSK